MKIGNIQIYLHRHKFEDKVESEYQYFEGGWVAKIVRTCIVPGCQMGSHDKVAWIYCENKPDITRVEFN